MKKIIVLVVVFIIFVWIGRQVTDILKKDDPSFSESEIAYFKECASTMNDPIGRIPMIFGYKSIISKKDETTAYIKYYGIYAIPLYTILSKGNSCSRVH